MKDKLEAMTKAFAAKEFELFSVMTERENYRRAFKETQTENTKIREELRKSSLELKQQLNQSSLFEKIDSEMRAHL